MSLTQKQWLEMWTAIKAIENNYENFDRRTHPFKELIDANIGVIKDKIQQVIGQME